MLSKPRRIRQALEAGHRAYGAVIQLPSADIVEIAGKAGYDYAWIDAEHGCLSLNEIRDLVRAADAAGIDAIVRVPDHSTSFIQRVLDIGATGIMVPHVGTVEQATTLASSARYGPSGTRGACPLTRSVGHLTFDWTADSTAADRDVLVFVLIEDLEGVQNVEAIASESGLDGLVFGPFDLAVEMGLAGDITHPDVRAHHARVTEACRSAGSDYVVAAASWEFEGIDACGGRIVTVASDRASLWSSFATELNQVRASLTEGAIA